MTNSTLPTGLSAREMVQARMAKTLRRRHRRERNFRMAGLASVCVALACVLLPEENQRFLQALKKVLA